MPVNCFALTSALINLHIASTAATFPLKSSHLIRSPPRHVPAQDHRCRFPRQWRLHQRPPYSLVRDLQLNDLRHLTPLPSTSSLKNIEARDGQFVRLEARLHVCSLPSQLLPSMDKSVRQIHDICVYDCDHLLAEHMEHYLPFDWDGCYRTCQQEKGAASLPTPVPSPKPKRQN